MAMMLLFALAALQSPPAPVASPGQPVTSDRRMFFRPHTPSESEVLQRATSLAIGNLAWESVTVSEVRRTSNQVRWTATTRSNRYLCTADSSGENPFCDRP
jgi:hypothetical protein